MTLLASSSITIIDIDDIVKGATPPSPAQEGLVWLDISGNPPYLFKTYRNGEWVPTAYETLEDLDPEQYARLLRSYNEITSLDDNLKLTRYERGIVSSEVMEIVGKRLGPDENMPTQETINTSIQSGEFYNLCKEARDLGIPEDNSVFSTYRLRYDNLIPISEYNPKPWDTSTEEITDLTTVSGDTWNNRWNNYYFSKNALERLINERTKEYADIVSDEARQQAIEHVSRTNEYEEAELANPTIIDAPVTSIGLPSIEGRHIDTWKEWGDNYVIDSENLRGKWTRFEGATLTYEEVDMSNEWGFPEAYRVRSTGGTNTLKGSWSTSNRTDLNMEFGKKYTLSIWVKNMSDTVFVLNTNGFVTGENQNHQIQPGWSGRFIVKGGERRADYNWFQCNIRTTNVSDNVDVILGRMQIIEGESDAPWRPKRSEAWFDQNRIQPVTAPSFTSTDTLTINSRFYGNGIDNDRLWWDRYGRAVKTKHWDELMLTGELNWVFSGRRLPNKNLARTDLVGSWGANDVEEVLPYTWRLRSDNSNQAGLYISEDSELQPNTDYILSFKTKRVSGTVNYIAGHSSAMLTNSTRIYKDGVLISTGSSWSIGDRNYNNSTEEHFYEVYFTTPSTYGGRGSDDRLYIQPNRPEYGSPFELDIWDLQVYRSKNNPPWQPAPEDDPSSGIKDVQIRDVLTNTIVHEDNTMVKSDGQLMPCYDAMLEPEIFPDHFRVQNTGAVWLMVWNKDTGWGYNYDPSVEEIKAYFHGWRMCNGEIDTVYNGTGRKAWYPIGDTNLDRAVGMEDVESSNNLVIDPSETSDRVTFSNFPINRQPLLDADENSMIMLSMDVRALNSGESGNVDMYLRNDTAGTMIPPGSNIIHIPDSNFHRIYHYINKKDITLDLSNINNISIALRYNGSAGTTNFRVEVQNPQLSVIPIPDDVSPSIQEGKMNHYQLVYKLREPEDVNVDYEGIINLLQGENEVSYNVPEFTPDIPSGGKIKYATTLATAAEDIINIIPTMQRRLSRAEQVITDESITNTVINSVEYRLSLETKADVSDLGNLVNRDELDDAEGRLNDNIHNAIDSIDFDPYLTKSEWDQEATNITAKFHATGGANLIKNSVGFAGLDHFDSTSTTGAYAIQNSELDELGFGSGFFHPRYNNALYVQSQVVNVIPNTYYTLSFYLKINRLNASQGTGAYAHVSVVDGETTTGNPYLIQNTIRDENAGYTRYAYTFVPSGNKVLVRLGSRYADLTYTGIMLNIGDQGLQWSLATGEVYNTNIRMDLSGIRVSQKNSEGNEVGYTQITPQEFAGYYEDGNGAFEKVFYLNEDETVTKKLRAREEITMGNVKIVQVNLGGGVGWAFLPNLDDPDS